MQMDILQIRRSPNANVNHVLFLGIFSFFLFLLLVRILGLG